MDYFIGIDPGKSGGYAVISRDLSIQKIANFTSMKDLYETIKQFKIRGAVLEEVHMMPNTAAKSGTTFMKNAGGEEAILEVTCRYQLIKPQAWQKECGVVVAKPKLPPKIDKKKFAGNKKELNAAMAKRKKDVQRINREHKEKVKEKSIAIASRYFSIKQSELNEHTADALNMARVAARIFT